MDEEKAIEILGDWISDDGDLFDLGAYISFEKGDQTVSLDGHFTADALEAVVWWMRNKGGVE
jgi:hypothetical protein